MGEQSQQLGNPRLWFWGLLTLAIALRVAAFDPFAVHHPDEVLQYLEPAYRLLTGDGIVTWEYRYGMRGWLLPWLLAGPMALGKAIGGNALAGIVAARIAVAAINLVPVIAAWHLGRRSSLAHAIAAMAVMALWYEPIYFSSHVLTEVLATSCFLGAAAMIDGKAGRGRIVAAGALLAAMVVLRFHYAVAAGTFALLTLGSDWKRWGWLTLGAIPVAALSGAIDLAMGQWPFEWVVNNFQHNVIEGRAAQFGVEEPGFYVKAIWDQWGWLAVPIALLAVNSGKAYRPILYAAVFNLAAHSLIGHKEYRFVELTSATAILLAAVGSVNLVQALTQRRQNHWPALASLALLLLGWASASAWLGRGDPLDRWFGERMAGPELTYAAGRDRRVCGLGTMTVEFWQLSRVYLDRSIPILLLDNSPRPFPKPRPEGPEMAGINAVIAPAGSKQVLPGYSLARCRGEEPYRRCLYVRQGGCASTPETQSREVQNVLVEIDW